MASILPGGADGGLTTSTRVAPRVWLVAALGLGAASCLIQIAMNWAQREVPPTRATIIYAGEPVWGGIFGRLAGDRLPGLALVGAALIIIGTLVSELKPRLKSEVDTPAAELSESTTR
ncbi:DMT family transporter [Saccharopolyspora gregorii]|uniref:DMT family transporter n=1 Tax=Saccharopolyspora gregorii TaxID=33914 RepID=UPI0021AD39FB|nr:DMT family transporter [Saccharopolyspora gregorii]